MTEDKKTIKKIITKRESGKEFSIEYEIDEPSLVIDSYFQLEKTVEIIDYIEYFRQMATDNGMGFFIPKDSSLNQMKRLSLSAAATFPKALPSIFIEKDLEIPFNSYKVYATAKEHESSYFLELDIDKKITFLPNGFLWLKSILDQ